jgi:hypothetical protein
MAALSVTRMLRNRIAELKAIRDQTRADTGRAQEPSITPQALKTFTRQARKRMRIKSSGYAAITYARSLSASKSMRGKFASWAREAVLTHAYCVVSRIHACDRPGARRRAGEPPPLTDVPFQRHAATCHYRDPSSGHSRAGQQFAR